jgi:hypothetical protein
MTFVLKFRDTYYATARQWFNSSHDCPERPEFLGGDVSAWSSDSKLKDTPDWIAPCHVV